MPTPRCSFHSPRQPGQLSGRSLAVAAAGTACSADDASTAAAATAAPPLEMTVIPTALPVAPRSATIVAPPARGGYGNLKRGGAAAPPAAQPKAFPKSANFARMPTGLEVDDEDRMPTPQSARAAVRSWSSTGGMREATFKKKRPPSNGAFGGGGLSILAQAQKPYSQSSLTSADEEAADSDEEFSVAMLVEELILRVENEGNGGARPAAAHAAVLAAAAGGPREGLSRVSSLSPRISQMDIDGPSSREG